MEEKTFRILVVHHKKDRVYKDDVYMPVHAGKSLSDIDLGMAGDDTGDNISDRNPSFCELTALYWAWKNLKGTDFIGLCHYRRYFDFHHTVPDIYYAKNESVSKMDSFDFTLPEEARERLINGETVVSVPKTMNRTVFRDYCKRHSESDLYLLRQTIEESSSQYLDAFDKVMLGNEYSPYNMFVMSWNDFDRYCSWLFGILFRLEGKLDISSRSKYQQRVYGFMAERLLNVFLTAENKRLDRYPVIMFNEGTDYKRYSVLKQYFSLMIKRLQFMFNKDTSGYRRFTAGYRTA